MKLIQHLLKQNLNNQSHLPVGPAKNAKRNTVQVKFMFSKKVTKIDKIFTVDLTLCCKYQIDGEDFINFCGLLRKLELNKHEVN